MPGLLGTKIASRYRLIRQIGRGGMGEVYLAKHLHTGEDVALKVLLAEAGATPQAVERFRREMRAPGRIKSDHVVRVTDADVAPELDGAPFLVMELLDGCNLNDLLQHRGMLAEQEMVWILGQVAKALDKAHVLGIVHRDLKPENLFLHRREEDVLVVKILDFGIALVKEPANLSISGEKLTQTGQALGTLMYMSPEQAAGKLSEIGPASDIWSLGMIAFELLAGTSYFTAQTPVSLLFQITLAPMPLATARSAALPRAFDAWFSRSCDREVSNRWPSAGAQVAALAEALQVSPEWLRSIEPPASLNEAIKAVKKQEAKDTDLAGLTSEDSVSDTAASSVGGLTARETPDSATVVLPARPTAVSQPEASTRGSRQRLLLAALAGAALSVVMVATLWFTKAPRSSSSAIPSSSVSVATPPSQSPDLASPGIRDAQPALRPSIPSAESQPATPPPGKQRPVALPARPSRAPASASKKGAGSPPSSSKAPTTTSGYDPSVR